MLDMRLVRQYELSVKRDDDNNLRQKQGQAIGAETWAQRGLLSRNRTFLQEETVTKTLRAVKRRLFSNYKEIHTLIALKTRQDLFVDFLGWYSLGGDIYLTMEYIEHGNLKRYLKDFGLHAKYNARKVTAQLLEGLNFLHELGIAHRGVNPENILIASYSPIRVKLIYLEHFSRSEIGATINEILGYSAPEQLELRPDKSWSGADMWALGCVLYQMLTSERPFDMEQGAQRRSGSTGRDLEIRLLFIHGRSINDIPTEKLKLSGASIAVIDLVRKLLLVNPNSRPSATKALEHIWITTPFLTEYKLEASVPSPNTVAHTWSTWRTVKRVTQGIIGTAWVEKENTGKLRIVKIVRMDTYQAEEVSYQKELEFLITLEKHHDNFIQFFGWYEHKDCIFLAMEYAEYGDLENYLKIYGQEAKTEVSEIIGQILGGFIVLQQEGLDYRYFKPKNALISCKWPIHIKLLLADFGAISATTSLYMAPELFYLLPPETSLDTFPITAANMWALGCLIHKILTREELFSMRDPNSPDPDTPTLDTASLQRFYSGEITLPLKHLQPSLTNEKWTCLLQKILVADPNSRISAKEALENRLMKTFKVINKHRWKATSLEDGKKIYRTHFNESVWKEDRRIASGGMGSVWLMVEVVAKKVVQESKIAIKKLPRDFYINLKIDFTREIQALLQVKDYTDLFVHFLGWYEDENSIFLAMEYAEYGDLSTYLKKHKSDAKLYGKEISTQILEGLVFLHERHICHRDLKPQNVLVFSSVPIRVKLADFGLAKSTQHSKLYTRCGTEGYKAPELHTEILPQYLKTRKNSEYTNAVDIWSLGCLIHKILTFEIPFLENVELSSGSGINITEEPLDCQSWSLFRGFCQGERDFPRASLHKAGICQMGIDFVEKMLVPDPKLRISATEALKSQWLCSVSQQDSLTGTASKTIRDQLLSLGIHISQRTADSLMMHAEGSRNAEVKGYLPSAILNHLRELQHKASLAGFTLLLRVLFKVRIISSPDSLTIDTWAIDSPGLERPPEPINTSYDKMTILQAAVRSKVIETVEFLLSAGYNVNEVPVDASGRTALQEAAASGNPEVVMLLLSKGAMVNTIPSKSGGRTALQAAAEIGHIGIVTMLLDNNADVNADPAELAGRTALQAAAGSGYLRVVKLLLKHNADIHAPPCSIHGRTALQSASESGNIKIVRLLLERDADPNAQPSPGDGRTALHAAAENGHSDVAMLLLEFNANPSFGEWIAEKDASKNGHEVVVQLLARVRETRERDIKC